MDCERILLKEIADPKATRDELALTYGLSLCSSEFKTIDWAKVNRAIIERWSMSALLYIKRRAWKR